MFIFKAINFITPFMYLSFILGIILCASSLSNALSGKKKIPNLYFAFFAIPLIFFVGSKDVLIASIESLSENPSTKVTSPNIDSVDARYLLKNALKNRFSSKKSGSHPVDTKTEIYICEKKVCGKITLAKDSRDNNFYWLTYVPFEGAGVPLGYTKI